MRFFILTVVALIVVCWLGEASGQGLRSQEVPHRQRRRSPIESEIFLGDWWDYYNRAIRRFDEGDLAGAEEDFRQALKYRPEEGWQARTYGVRFQEYFPKAELGAVLFEQGKYAEALPILQESLASAPFEQTRFYIHETRREIALAKGEDQSPPNLVITGPASGSITNQMEVDLKGFASDDLFVDSITINDQPVFVDWAQNQVSFDTRVKLTDQQNHFTVRVTDLVGRVREQEILVEADHQGPVFCVDRCENLVVDNKVVLVGKALDKSHVDRVMVNNQYLSIQTGRHVNFNYEIETNTPDDPLLVILFDGLGNETRALVPPRMRLGQTSLDLSNTIKVAAPGFDPAWLVTSGVGPVITLMGISTYQRVYLDQFAIDARVYDASGVADVRFNQQQLDEFLPGREVFVSKLTQLATGENHFSIQARNGRGDVTEETIVLDARPPCSIPVEQKLSVAIPDFEIREEAVSPDMAKNLRGDLLASLVSRERFRVIEQDSSTLSSIFAERSIAQSEISNTRLQASDRKLLTADYILDGNLIVREKSIQIRLFIVAVSTGEVREVIDLSARREDGFAQYQMDALALRLEQMFPKVQGEIVSVDPRVFSTISKLDKVPDKSIVIAFKLLPEQFSSTGASLGSMTYDYGVFEIRRLLEKTSELKAVGELEDEISVGDIVVTR